MKNLKGSLAKRKINKPLAFTILAILLVIMPLWQNVLSRDGDPHERPGDCSDCHLRDPSRLMKDEASTQLFVSDIEAICLNCHSGIKISMSHPIAVRPSIPIPNDMYLDWKGEITCTTCHYMHTSASFSNPSLLRRNFQGRQFCYECHKPDFMNEKSLSHALASTRAHGGTFTPMDGSGQTIDNSSIQCMTCHDGSVSGDAGGTTVNMGIWRHQGPRHSHPIGVDYMEAWNRKKREFTPISMLPAEIVLPDGKVECVSCHNLYSHNEHLLALNNFGSKLCLSCHVK